MSSLRERAEITARIDRLPITRMQWTWLIAIQIVWGLLVGTVDGLPARIYPYVWLPAHQISSSQFTWMIAFDFGVGIFLGEYVGGYLGDRIGRRRTLLLAPVVAAVFVIPTAFTHNFWALIVLYTVSNASVGLMIAVNVALMSELIGPNRRGRLLFTSQVAAVVVSGIVANIPAAHMVPGDWQAYIILMGAIAFGLSFPLLYFCVPESPRWMVERHGRDRADQALAKIEARCAKLTRQPLPAPLIDDYLASATAEPEAGKFNPRELFGPAYRRNTILLLVTWFVGYTGIVFGYGSYSLTFFAQHGMSANTNFNRNLIASIVGAGLALAVAGALNERVERKYIVGGAGVLFGAAFMLVWFWPSNLPVVYVLSILFTGGASLWLFAMYNYNSASYPTRIRAVATGWTDGIGHLGGIIGLVPVGYLYAAAAPSYLTWFLYVTIIGGAVPALAIAWFGMRMKGRNLD